MAELADAPDLGYLLHAGQRLQSQPKTPLSAFDIPTTLLAPRNAIELILGGRSVGLTTDQERLEQREIRNFARILRLLIDKEDLHRHSVRQD